MRTVAVIQARFGSSRLPGKIFADVAGVPMLTHVVARAQRAARLDVVAIATTDKPADDRVAEFCTQAGIPCVRGSEDDVLDRYLKAARELSADVIVRLTADCPLLDPEVIDKVVAAFFEGGHDYVANILECTYPDGLDTEVIARDALERAGREARLKSEREHVTPYIRNHPELFRLQNVRHHEDLSALRWTVDNAEDLEFVREVYARLGTRPFGLAEVQQLLREHPEIQAVNAGISRNEGYQKSLREDVLLGEDPSK